MTEEKEKFILYEKEKKKLEEIEIERKRLKGLKDLLTPKVEFKPNSGPPPKAPTIPQGKKKDEKTTEKKPPKVLDEKQQLEILRKKEEGLRKKEKELKKKQEEELKKKLEKKEEKEDNDDSMLFAEFFSADAIDHSGIDMSKWMSQEDEHSDDMGDEWIEPKDLEEKRSRYKCKNFYTLSDVVSWEESGKSHKNPYPEGRLYEFNPELNKKISIWKGSATNLEVDAVVNAANTSLLGGGGIDGAIHKASGRFLKKECKALDGCKTGKTKITKGYKLPAKYVLHTVGPTSDDDELLRGCYDTCLELVEQNGIKTVGFCCISTGIFGYPLRDATLVALSAVRRWLEKNKDLVDRIIFITFLEEETKEYELLCPYFFPIKN